MLGKRIKDLNEDMVVKEVKTKASTLLAKLVPLLKDKLHGPADSLDVLSVYVALTSAMTSVTETLEKQGDTNLCKMLYSGLLTSKANLEVAMSKLAEMHPEILENADFRELKQGEKNDK